MPLATDLLPLLVDQLELDEMRSWLESLSERLAWLSESNATSDGPKVNIEQVFHYAHFDAELHRLRHHLSAVGRNDGPGTEWIVAESISAWLSYLEDALRDVLVETEGKADRAPIERWAATVRDSDTVLTFNYDTLAERALSEAGKQWHHGTRDGESGVLVCKLHGSIDWIVANRAENLSKLDLIFDKENANRSARKTGFVEEDYRLWRCRSWQQLEKWVSSRDLQSLPEEAAPRTVGIAGLGAYKQLHRIPGLGCVWTRGLRKLYEADKAVVIGFSMSDFDAFAQMQFAQIARARATENRPLQVTGVDPYIENPMRERFHRVFRTVDFVKCAHETFDWNGY